MAWTLKAVTAGEAQVPYLEAGAPDSPNVAVLIHAFPVGMRIWEPVPVPDGWRALAPALPGFDGADLPPRDSTSLDDYARAVLAFMDRLRLDSAVLGGVSMGGYVSFALWRLERLRWRGLVLADTRAEADSAAARAARDDMLQTLRSSGTGAVADAMLPKLLGETTRSRRPQLVDHVRRLIERQTVEGVAAAVTRLRDRPDSVQQLGEIEVPVLVVVGEEDTVTPPAESEQMCARLADARLVRIAGAGHLACMENPPAFGEALASFLSSLRR